MRIAWDLQAITGPRPTGLGVSVGFLLRALRDHAPEVEVVELRPNACDKPLRGVPDRLAWEQLRLPAALRREHARQPLDLAYSPALGAPLSSPVPVVAHVHDLIPLHFPQQFSGVAGWYWKELLPFTWQRCRALTVSNHTVADDIAQRLGYPRGRIHVVPYYPEPEFARLAAEAGPVVDDWAGAPRFVTIGSHEPRKNIELAIRAVGLLRSRGIPARLTCIGLHTPYTARLRELAQQAGAEVEFPEYAARAEVVRLLRQATALLFVSRYEGYGMPPLEAMSIGCAVVLSDIPAHRAVYRGSGMPFVGVDDLEALSTVMLRLCDDAVYLAGLRRSGLAYCEMFTPEATAEALVGAFRSAAEA